MSLASHIPFQHTSTSKILNTTTLQVGLSSDVLSPLLLRRVLEVHCAVAIRLCAAIALPQRPLSFGGAVGAAVRLVSCGVAVVVVAAPGGGVVTRRRHVLRP